jgi:hypothetical protein
VLQLLSIKVLSFSLSLYPFLYVPKTRQLSIHLYMWCLVIVKELSDGTAVDVSPGRSRLSELVVISALVIARTSPEQA